MSAESTHPPAQIREEAANGLEALFQRYYPAVLALFRRRGFSESECEDLAQETFLRVHHGLPDYRGEAPIEHWLFRIASNTAKASLRFRSASRRSAVVVSLEPSHEGSREETEAPPDPLRAVLATERSEQLLTAVDRLPARMRRCVLLSLKQGLRYREIAEVLQISEQTVKVQLLKARGHLRGFLTEGVDPEERRR